MKLKSTYHAALYMRLSRDDDGATESASISTQRKMLRSYAAEHGFVVYEEYVDDGWSGTNFDRPGFQRMIADIEAQKVNLVLTKDLSRLGRDYITAGQYTEIYFPSKGVRYIAINDGYDSDGAYADIVPFKNILNEMYARDTSRKIRSALETKMREGAYIAAFAPYGYQKDPLDKNHLVVDAVSGGVVREIFSMAANGALPVEIARTLNARAVPPPAVYRCMTHDGLDVNRYSRRKEWTSTAVSKMLRNPVYLGHMAQGKTTKVSFKSRMMVNNPRDEWFVVQHTHEALVDEETFDLVRRRTAARTYSKNGTFYNMFSGIAKCADCGRNMSATGTRKKGSPANLTCGGYKLYGSGECSNHFIDYNVLYEIVQKSLEEQLCLSREERSAIVDHVQNRRQKQERKADEASALVAFKKRLQELEHIIGKLYEDNAAGRLSSVRMEALVSKYEREAEALEARVAALEQQTDESGTSDRESREKLDEMLRQITEIKELTPGLLFRLIDHIEIGQGYYEQGEHGRVKHQTVKIFYRFQTEATVKTYTL